MYCKTLSNHFCINLHKLLYETTANNHLTLALRPKGLNFSHLLMEPCFQNEANGPQFSSEMLEITQSKLTADVLRMQGVSWKHE